MLLSSSAVPCLAKVIYVLAQCLQILSSSYTSAEIVKSAYIYSQACMKHVMLCAGSWNTHHEILVKQSGRVQKKIDTGGVPTMLHLVLSSENVPDCKNLFLRETVKVQSTQPFKLKQSFVDWMYCWEITQCVQV